LIADDVGKGSLARQRVESTPIPAMARWGELSNGLAAKPLKGLIAELLCER
jgi:hypothetical protein